MTITSQHISYSTEVHLITVTIAGTTT